MNLLTKIGITFMVMNLFAYMGVNFSISLDGERALNEDYHFYFEGDAFSSIMVDRAEYDQMIQSYRDNWTDYDYNFTEETVTVPAQESGFVADNIPGLDVVKMVYPWILAIANLAMAPLALFFNFQMPFYLGMMIGIPYMFLFIFGLMAFIRGV